MNENLNQDNNEEKTKKMIEEEEIINLLKGKENTTEKNLEEINQQNKESPLINIEDSHKTNKDEIINDNNENKYKIIGDYIITIQYTKTFKIPYFIFGNIVNFYCPFHKFEAEQVNLSQISTPPFTITLSECK